MSSSSFSLAQIRASYTPEKRQGEALFTQWVLRPLSFPLTWLLLRLHVSANQVSYFSILVVLVATIFMFIESRLFVMVGLLLFIFWGVLDAVDGTVARLRRTAGPSGGFVDAISGGIAWALVLLAAGVAAQWEIGFLFVFSDGIDFVLMGALASISNLLVRLFYQRYRLLVEDDSYAEGSSLRRWTKDIGITGFMLPAMLICAFAGVLRWVVLFYTVYHVLALVLVTIRMLRAVEATKDVKHA